LYDTKRTVQIEHNVLLNRATLWFRFIYTNLLTKHQTQHICSKFRAVSKLN